jgi:hypothetical protein
VSQQTRRSKVNDDFCTHDRHFSSFDDERRRRAHQPRRFPNGVVNFIDLRHGGRAGGLADQRTDASFQGPSSIARARDRYLVVNPDFATSTPPFTVTALPR